MQPNIRPPVPPPQPPEPIYEPPINFRENSPRLYGPCGTIRYAQPDGLYADLFHLSDFFSSEV